MRLTFIASLAALALVASASEAAAQYGQPPPPQQPPLYADVPQSYFFGAGIGGGTQSYASANGETESIGTINFALNGGLMLIPGRLAIIFDIGAAVYPEGDYTVTTSTALLGGRFYLGNIVWVQAGVGLGQLAISFNNCIGEFCDTVNEAGFAFGAAAGVNLLRSPQGFALDLSLRASSAVVGTDQFGDTATASGVAVLIGGSLWR